jgi:hypothetical protein
LTANYFVLFMVVQEKQKSTMANSMQGNVQSWKARLDTVLNDKNSCLNPLFEIVESKTGVKRLHFTFGMISCFVLMIDQLY